MKNYLIVYSTRTIDIFDFRDDQSLGLITAENQQDALRLAYEHQCSEAFDEDAPPLPPRLDEPTPGFCDDGTWLSVPAGIGEWTTANGHPAFQLGDAGSGVDHGCILWIDSVTEVPGADAEVHRRYL